ncbi:hypothetical protein Tco_0518868, partial [Tanacetum coccineum]
LLLKWPGVPHTQSNDGICICPLGSRVVVVTVVVVIVIAVVVVVIVGSYSPWQGGQASCS